MRQRTVTFQVSGAAMDIIANSAIFKQHHSSDPLVREVALGLREAEEGIRGVGRTYTVWTSIQAAKVIMDFCTAVGRELKAEPEKQRKVSGQALLIVADRIYWKLKEMGEKVTNPTR